MKVHSTLTGSIARAFGPLGLVCVLLCPGTIRISAQSAQVESLSALYRGDYTRAAQLAKKYLRDHPRDNAVRVILGRSELAQGHFQPAFEEMTRVLSSDSHNIDALYYLSLIARASSQQQYQQLMAFAPESDRAHELLGEAALAAGKTMEAEEEFLHALKINPRCSEVAIALGELKRSQSKFDEAISYYLQAEQPGSMTYDIAYGLGACFTYKQEYRQAIAWLRKAVVLSPDSAAGRFALANALFQNSELETAIPELKRSLELQPSFKQAYFLLGRIYSKLGRQEEAKAALRKLDELSRSEMPSPDQGDIQKDH